MQAVFAFILSSSLFGAYLTFLGQCRMTFLLPFWHQLCFFVQCSKVPFTVSASTTLFRAMQRGSFYRFSINHSISGRAERFLLPFSHQSQYFGTCSSIPFPLSNPPYKAISNNGRPAVYSCLAYNLLILPLRFFTKQGKLIQNNDEGMDFYVNGMV